MQWKQWAQARKGFAMPRSTVFINWEERDGRGYLVCTGDTHGCFFDTEWGEPITASTDSTDVAGAVMSDHPFIRNVCVDHDRGTVIVSYTWNIKR